MACVTLAVRAEEAGAGVVWSSRKWAAQLPLAAHGLHNHINSTAA